MENETTVGKIIIINGPSSSGKSTLALALQREFDIPLLRFSFDVFLENHVLPMDQIDKGAFSWSSMRSSVFAGIHRCLPALATAGNNLIFDHIIETQGWMDELIELLKGLDVYFVGLHCTLEELERREMKRGDRRIGEARADLETVHSFGTYDLELNSENSVEENTKVLIAAWKKRQRPSAFEKMAI